MKRFRKILLYSALAVVLVMTFLGISVYVFKDELIRKFIEQANEHLNTPVKVDKIEVSLFEKFPNISIVFTDVYVEDSHEGMYPLFTANTLSFQLNPFDLWKGKYVITGLQVKDSETNLKVDAQGKSNYSILKEATQKEKSDDIFILELKNIGLKNTRVRYFDLAARQDLIFTSQTLVASIKTSNHQYAINAEGEVTTEQLSIDGKSYLDGRWFLIDSELLYNDDLKKISILPSSIKVRESNFSLSGEYGWKEQSSIDLMLIGKNTDIQTVVGLLPESVGEKFAKYRSKGDVYFESRLVGDFTPNKKPALSIDFGFNDATIYHPDLKARITEANLTGSYRATDLNKASNGTLQLDKISGKLNGEPFQARFVLRDFDNPDIQCDFKGVVNAAALSDFYPIPTIKNLSGTLSADLSFSGKIEFLKDKATAQRVSTRGAVDMTDIQLLYGKDNIAVQGLNGVLQFSNNDLALSDVRGKLGKSDFLLNGFFKNVITFLLFDNQPIGIEADLKSQFVDLDELFAYSFGESSAGSQGQEYAFSLSKNVNLNFNCDVNALKYKRFNGKRLRGDLLIKNEMAVSRKITVESGGGDITLSGIVDAKNPKAIDVVSSFKLNGIHLDSAFYVFENFHQDFIEDKHLKGKAYADVSLEMTLKPNLKLFPETLVADISATIKNGELNNFEPMLKLNKFVRDNTGLKNLRFSDIKNDIHIEKKTIYIPQMEVRTNVTSLVISGTHTFDQQIDYRVNTPLRRDRTLTSEESNAVGNDASGQSRLFLKIVGTTDDYRIVYDVESVRKKITNDLKQEVKELRDAFKNKGTQQKKEVELEQEDYFDWD